MRRDCRIEVDSHLPAGVRDELSRRFGQMDVRDEPDGTVLCAGNLDQAGLRALLGLLWDAGLQISAVTATPRSTRPAP